MADILKIFLLIVGGLLIFVSFWLAAEALFPALVERARNQYSRPGKLTFAGLAMVAPFILGALGIFKISHPVMNIVGIALLAVVFIGGLAGSAGLAKRVGVGLPSPVDDAQPWRRVLRGGIVLTLTFLLPFIGWIGLTIWSLVTGFAAWVFAVREAKKATPTEPPAAPKVELSVTPPAAPPAIPTAA